MELCGLGISWRERFFQEIHTRFTQGDLAEDIDVTHRRALDAIIENRGIGLEALDEDFNVIPALRRLRASRHYFLVVLANGTTILQLDIAQSSDIPFHMLMSSELLGLTKPDPRIYDRVIELVRVSKETCYMLASHLYDLEAAKKVGMKTIYVHKETEDVGVAIDLCGEHLFVDQYFDGRVAGNEDERGFLEWRRRCWVFKIDGCDQELTLDSGIPTAETDRFRVIAVFNEWGIFGMTFYWSPYQ